MNEREAFEAWLLGSYGKVYSKEDCDRFVEHGHVSWLSWLARAAVEADRAQRVPDVEDLKDRLVAISSAVADSDDREAQAIIRTTLELLASTPAQPAQQERNPMTPEQVAETVFEVNGNEPSALFWRDLVSAVERHHGIKE